jgi:hypothetical protein
MSCRWFIFPCSKSWSNFEMIFSIACPPIRNSAGIRPHLGKRLTSAEVALSSRARLSAARPQINQSKPLGAPYRKMRFCVHIRGDGDVVGRWQFPHFHQGPLKGTPAFFATACARSRWSLDRTNRPNSCGRPRRVGFPTNLQGFGDGLDVVVTSTIFPRRWLEIQ